MTIDERLYYLGTIPHAQRSILLLSATMAFLHPINRSCVQNFYLHHPMTKGEDLCIQALLDLMISIASKWSAGSSVLLPATTLMDQAATFSAPGRDLICPLVLAEKLWELIEQVHEQPEMPLSEVVQDPSSN